MSAFLVSPKQIGMIARHKQESMYSTRPNPRRELREGHEHYGKLIFGSNSYTGKGMYYNEEELVELLIKENIASLQARYPDMWFTFFFPPGEEGSEENIKDRIRSHIVEAKAYAKLPDLTKPIDMLGYIKCYQYQSCKHEGWFKSDAKWITDHYIQNIYNELVPYETWEVSNG